MAKTLENGHILIAGRSGSGKSTHMRKILKERPRVIVFDPMAKIGAKGVYSGSFTTLYEQVKKSPARFSLTYTPKSGVDHTTALDRLATLVLRIQKPFFDGRKGAKRLTFVIEEVGTSFTQHTSRKFGSLYDVFERGRHYGLDVIAVTQVLGGMNATVRQNTPRKVILAQDDGNERMRAAQLLGLRTAQVPVANYQGFEAYQGEVTRLKITRN